MLPCTNVHCNKYLNLFLAAANSLHRPPYTPAIRDKLQPCANAIPSPPPDLYPPHALSPRTPGTAPVRPIPLAAGAGGLYSGGCSDHWNPRNRLSGCEETLSKRLTFKPITERLPTLSTPTESAEVGPSQRLLLRWNSGRRVRWWVAEDTRQANPCVGFATLHAAETGLVAGCPAYATGLVCPLIAPLFTVANPAEPFRFTSCAPSLAACSPDA